jgi:hypothetical protein
MPHHPHLEQHWLLMQQPAVAPQAPPSVVNLLHALGGRGEGDGLQEAAAICYKMLVTLFETAEQLYV